MHDPEYVAARRTLLDALDALGGQRQALVLVGAQAIVTVDLLVPRALGGPGRRAARMGESHGKRTAMKAHGLEAAVVDNQLTVLGALVPADSRSFEIRVAGPAALLVSKIHKVAERRCRDPKDPSSRGHQFGRRGPIAHQSRSTVLGRIPYPRKASRAFRVHSGSLSCARPTQTTSRTPRRTRSSA